MRRLRNALRRAVRLIEAITERSGNLARWLIVPLIAALSYEVLARYLFDAPTAWAFETTYMLYGSFFMLGAAYALLKGAHIRTDMLYSHLPLRWQASIDAISYGALLLPVLIAFLVVSSQEAIESWRILEKSEASTWRPPLYPLKTVIPLAIALLLLQAIAEFLKSLYTALEGERL